MRPDGSWGGGEGARRIGSGRILMLNTVTLKEVSLKVLRNKGFVSVRFLTCISFVVPDESFGEEPDHQSCNSEKKTD